MIADKKYILFDLDGTLTDPKLGICTCVQHALRAFGIEEPNLDKLEPFIGPPLKDSFMQFYGLSEEDAQKAIVTYRERFSTVGKFENEVYEGIPEMLRALKEYGYQLAVASSKPEIFVKDILKHFQIAEYFDVVVGSELDGSRVEKQEVIHEALNRMFHYRAFQKQKVVMVGDRKFDVDGAKEIGVTSVAVAYGYGPREELKTAAPDYIVDTVADLRALFIDEEELILRKREAIKEKAAQEKAAREAAEAQKHPKPSSMQMAWKLLFPFLLYNIGGSLIQQLLLNAAMIMGDKSKAFQNFMFAPSLENPELLGVSGNGGAIVQTITMLLVCVVLWKFGNGKEKLEQGNNVKAKINVTEWAFWTGLAIVAAVGINMLFAGLGILTADTAYQEAADSLYSVGVPLGLVLYGIAAPLAEELLFRGIIFQEVKSLWKPKHAVLISAAFFGVYHGNGVQMVYGFCLGAVLAYAYHYSRKFALPVMIHSIVNIIIFQASNYGWISGSAVQLVIGAVLTAVAVLVFFRVNKVHQNLEVKLTK